MTTPNDHPPPARPLSEKAKGKQRAREVDDEDAPGPSSSSSHRPHSPATRVVTIRFTEGVKDLNLDISERETVRDIKSKVSGRIRDLLANFFLTLPIQRQDSSHATFTGEEKASPHPFWPTFNRWHLSLRLDRFLGRASTASQRRYRHIATKYGLFASR